MGNETFLGVGEVDGKSLPYRTHKFLCVFLMLCRAFPPCCCLLPYTALLFYTRAQFLIGKLWVGRVPVERLWMWGWGGLGRCRRGIHSPIAHCIVVFAMGIDSNKHVEKLYPASSGRRRRVMCEFTHKHTHTHTTAYFLTF